MAGDVRLKREPTPAQLAGVVGVAVLALGVSAPLVRGMEAGPLAIAAWRTAAASLLLAPAVWRAPAPTRSEHLALAAAGAALAGHFALWFTSLQLTTVLRSTVLVCLTPLWAGILEWAVDREPPPPRFWLGAALAVAGSGALAGGHMEGGSVAGDALATLAGVLWPLYLRLTRGYRRRANSLAAMGRVCAVASAICFGLGAATGERLAGWSADTWALLALAVALPQLVGHQGLAWAVAWVPASRLSAATLLEPVVAATLAALWFHERPGAGAIAGAGLVLVGVWVCVGRDRSGAEVPVGMRGRPNEGMLRGGPMRMGGARPAQGLGPHAQAALKRAWDLRERDPSGSAAEFERMARIASERDMAGMATHLALQGARSAAAGGNDDTVILLGQAAVQYASGARNPAKSARKISGLVAELRAGGHAASAEAIETAAKGRLGLSALPSPTAASGLNRSAKRTLPRGCPTCAAPVDYEPEYGEDGVPDCRYCGVGLLG